MGELNPIYILSILKSMAYQIRNGKRAGNAELWNGTYTFFCPCLTWLIFDLCIFYTVFMKYVWWIYFLWGWWLHISPNFRVCARQQVPAKRFKIYHILFYIYKNPGHSLGKNIKLHEMKNKKTTWVFSYIKYGKFWSVSLEHFIKHKLPISEGVVWYLLTW